MIKYNELYDNKLSNYYLLLFNLQNNILIKQERTVLTGEKYTSKEDFLLYYQYFYNTEVMITVF